MLFTSAFATSGVCSPARTTLLTALVVFLSDQGSAYGQHGLWGNSSWGTPGSHGE